MHKLLERLDGATSTLVPLLYLAGLAAGTLAYFADVKIGFTLAVGVALALAAELHSFLMQRRIRALWGAYTRARARAASSTVDATGEASADALASQLWVQGGILAGLVVFSCYNSIAFVASTWTPAPGWLPAWLQIGIRGGIIPALFLVTGFLSPLSTDASDVLASAARDMLHTTITATVKQWQGRVKRARKRGLNLAPVAVALMLDSGDANGARRIHMIDAGLAYAENGGDAGEALALTSTLAPASTPASIFTPTGASGGASSPTGGPNGGDDPTPDGTPSGGTGGAPRKGSKGGKGGARRSAPDASPPLLLVTGEGATPRRDSGMTRAAQQALWERDITHARMLLRHAPTISTRELARRLSVGRVYKCHPQRAATIRVRLAGEDTGASHSAGSTGARVGA